jgi:hypothetical protein
MQQKLYYNHEKVLPYHKIWNDNHPDDQIIPGDGQAIHHIDGNNSNDNPDNLQKMTRSEHAKLHVHRGRMSYYLRGKHILG